MSASINLVTKAIKPNVKLHYYFGVLLT